MTKNLISEKGYLKLKEQISFLVKNKLVKIIVDLAEARSHGDLSENAEYQAAKERKNLLEKQIVDIGEKINNSYILKKIKKSKKITYGSYVTLLDKGNKKINCYRITGDKESNVSLGSISVESPLSKLIIGKEVNDMVRIKTPESVKIYKIISIK